jgi:hypothetical protein
MTWSFTSLTSFETCPRRYYHTRVAKDIVEPESDAMIWGNVVHKALEERVRDGKPLPSTLTHLEKYAAKILSLPGTVACEQQVALTLALQPTDWFANNVWVRGVFDVAIDQGKQVVLIDYKTGKRKPNSDQLELFAALASRVYPKALRFRTLFIWLKEKKTDKAEYQCDDLRTVWAKFIRRVSRLDAAVTLNDFPPRPSGLCGKWCPIKSCEFCGR